MKYVKIWKMEQGANKLTTTGERQEVVLLLPQL